MNRDAIVWPIEPSQAPWPAPYVERDDAYAHEHGTPAFDDVAAADALIAENPDRLLVRIYDQPRAGCWLPAVYPWPA